MKSRYIIWDWNGTLLDDVDVAIESINKVLEKHGYKTLCGRDEYKDKFCFPIERYYRNIGFNFDKTPFHQLANEFIDIYQPSSQNCRLTNNANFILSLLQEKKYTQVILSASKQENLIQQVSQYGIEKHFSMILGIDNICATSKIDVGKAWARKTKISPEDMVVIGDTYHDYEVATALGCACFLYKNGHQKLQEKYFEKTVLIENIKDLEKYL